MRWLPQFYQTIILAQYNPSAVLMKKQGIVCTRSIGHYPCPRSKCLITKSGTRYCKNFSNMTQGQWPDWPAAINALCLRQHNQRCSNTPSCVGGIFREGFECVNADAKMAENGVRRGRKTWRKWMWNIKWEEEGNFFSHMWIMLSSQQTSASLFCLLGNNIRLFY